MCSRSKLGASAADYDEAAILLLKAAGLKKDDLKPGSTIPHNLTAHRGVLRELAKALEVCFMQDGRVVRFAQG